MTEERIVPVKSWLRPTTYRTLLQQAHARGLADVGDLLSRVAEQLVAPAPRKTVPMRAPRPKLSAEELDQRRTERRAAFAADSTDPRHGTHNGYTNLGCRCDPCRRASSLYGSAAKRAQAGTP